ncbi:hypothetical protein CI109_106943 [Kwoniella shandongensis]|uniref:Uncharacterized protein n=1 Tax=Kwoniella shandongensis TaxID=1734106 RepID=A0AAJ8N0U0_9TREE
MPTTQFWPALSEGVASSSHFVITATISALPLSLSTKQSSSVIAISTTTPPLSDSSTSTTIDPLTSSDNPLTTTSLHSLARSLSTYIAFGAAILGIIIVLWLALWVWRIQRRKSRFRHYDDEDEDEEEEIKRWNRSRESSWSHDEGSTLTSSSSPAPASSPLPRTQQTCDGEERIAPPEVDGKEYATSAKRGSVGYKLITNDRRMSWDPETGRGRPNDDIQRDLLTKQSWRSSQSLKRGPAAFDTKTPATDHRHDLHLPLIISPTGSLVSETDSHDHDPDTSCTILISPPPPNVEDDVTPRTL